MGRRKTGTAPLKEKSKVSWTVNMSPTARNLTKKELGAVIFGCKHHTIKECLLKQMFGLPASHYSYVKNVTPGLALFLFNYSDRKLHGIFEAASPGQMNINPYAWITSEGAEITPYAAQYLDSQEFSEMAETKLAENDHLYASVVVNKDAFVPEKKWTELFKTSSPSSVVESHERSESHEVKLESSVSYQFDMEWELASSSHKMNNLHPKSCKDAANTKYDSYVVDCWEQHALMNSDATKIYENKLSYLQYHEQDGNRLADLKDGISSQSRTSLYGKDGELKLLELESVVAKEPGEDLLDTKEEVRSCNHLAPKEKSESDHTVPNMSNRVFHENNNAMSGEVLMDIQPSDFESVIIKSESKLEIDQLKKRCHKLESVPSSANNDSDIQDCKSANFTAEKSVLILGGFDGCSWLSELSSYSLSENHFKSLCPMTFLRSHASIAKLNGELYIFGGVHDGVWYDTVESYNPMSNQWVKQPSLNQKKGSLAGVSIYDKIFAIGGGNGVECFSDVELFDLNIGRWISTQSMLEKKLFSVLVIFMLYAIKCFCYLVEMNQKQSMFFSLCSVWSCCSRYKCAIYVAGGYDGKDYLRSVERFDLREHAWTRIGSMNTKRGCHSLVAFNEKIYALGGYDGDKMVSSIEVLDPRAGSWMMEEPMQAAKGYFGSFVLGEKLYVVGGCMQEMEVLDVIESYAEGCGWQVVGRTALGKRCFFSSLVL
ncbi:UNVERIFIED_CONTAM: B2 protein [Sesamum calycinum]|uniref:B2 protein n=1 Tax=Sesamum calycinum TaxID=2727403 RepID=A0AAW2LTH3_9LAMI